MGWAACDWSSRSLTGRGGCQQVLGRDAHRGVHRSPDRLRSLWCTAPTPACCSAATARAQTLSSLQPWPTTSRVGGRHRGVVCSDGQTLRSGHSLQKPCNALLQQVSGHISPVTDAPRSLPSLPRPPCRCLARAERAAHLPRALHCPGHGRARPDQPPAGPQVWRLPHLWSAVAGARIWCARGWRSPVGWGSECWLSRCTELHEACLVRPSCHLLFCWG